jgi:hypothetical protein
MLHRPTFNEEKQQEIYDDVKARATVGKRGLGFKEREVTQSDRASKERNSDHQEHARYGDRHQDRRDRDRENDKDRQGRRRKSELDEREKERERRRDDHSHRSHKREAEDDDDYDRRQRSSNRERSRERERNQPNQRDRHHRSPTRHRDPDELKSSFAQISLFSPKLILVFFDLNTVSCLAVLLRLLCETNFEAQTDAMIVPIQVDMGVVMSEEEEEGILAEPELRPRLCSKKTAI